jgi:GTP-binding protein
MKVTTAEFVKSAETPSHYPEEDFPEIAFVGRSNVGKSSLINCILKRRKLAHTSNTPGRTQLINFFLVNDNFLFVDLPGYGYAKVPESVRKKWGPMVETYLMIRRSLKLVVMILDIRRDPSEDDLSLIQWLDHYDIPAYFVLTKADKLTRSNRLSRQAAVRESLGLPKDQELLLFSAKSGEGAETLRRKIEKTLSS